MYIHKECSVRLRFLTETILSADNDQLFTDFPHTVDHLDGVQGCGGAQVNVEDLLCVPDQAV